MQATSIRSAARSALVAALFTIGAAPAISHAEQGHHPKAVAVCQNCGVVVSTHSYKREPERSSGVGGVGGAVVGGLLGNQVGSGRGRTLATVAGAVGGAYAGNRIERNMKAELYTDVRVKMNKGGYRTFTEKGAARYRNGERVRVLNGRLAVQG